MAALRPTHRDARRAPWRHAALTLWIGAALALLLRAARPEELWQLIAHADRWWLLVALGCKLLTPLATAAVLQGVLRLLGFHIPLPALWLTAQVAIIVSMAAPAGAVAMSAFLLYVFRRRGISAGATTLAIALDGLTYGIAFGIFAALGLGYLLTHGELQVRQIREVVPLTLVVILCALALWGAQRDRADLTRQAVAAQRWLARRLRRSWSEARLCAFLDELYHGKALLVANRGTFARLVVLQAGAFALDALTLYCVIRALGAVAHPSVVLLGYVLAMFLTALTPLPGGGGVCEATLVLALTRLEVPLQVSLGATVLYRALTFWLPLLLSAVLAPRLLRAPVAGATAAEPER